MTNVGELFPSAHDLLSDCLGATGLGHFCIGLLFVLKLFSLASPFIHIMEDSTSSQPSKASAMTDGQPTGEMHMATLMRRLLAALEE